MRVTRTSGFGEQFDTSTAAIHVSQESRSRTDPNVDSFFFAGTADVLEAMPIDAAGRYVRVQMSAPEGILSLAEVRIYEM